MGHRAKKPGNSDIPDLPDASIPRAVEEDRTDTRLTLPKVETKTAVPLKPLNLGPLDSFMKDERITEIMVNDLRNVMVERDGKLLFSGFTYQRLEELNQLVTDLLEGSGKQLTPDFPYLDLVLRDGSRVNIVGPPVTLGGPCVTIRKFPARSLNMEDLVQSEMLDRRMAYFLNACVVGRMNIIVSGGTGGGKTTLLNALASFVPKGERIISIEDTLELSIAHANSVRLQSRSRSKPHDPNSPRELLANALRMRPDRILIGECRRGEAFDMLQAMNTGHEGSMTTLHANSARDALSRLETLCLMAGIELPLLAMRKQIVSAVDVVIHVKRLRSGSRKVLSISELTGLEGETVTMQDIYVFEADPIQSGKTDSGRFKCTGLVPTFLNRLRDNGVEIPGNYFN